MEINLVDSSVENINYDLEIVILKNIKNIEEELKKELKCVGFKAKESQVHFFNNTLYVGINKFKSEDIKIAYANAIRVIKNTNYKNIKIDLNNTNLEFILEGLILGNYSFTKYKSKVDEKQINILIDIEKSQVSNEELFNTYSKRVAISQSVNMVRDIVNTPPEDFFPETMALKAKEIAKEQGLKCKVYGEEYLKEQGMDAMLAVGRASRHESKLIHLTYKPQNPKGVVVLVGKGLTYDSGGLSLKSNMVSMKCDKSGASSVLGMMNSLNAFGCEYEVHGILGAVENMIGGDAYKPDDVLKAKNGVTIEVKNTDAEGRLVLADCLCYAQDNIENIDTIFDFATLTGACIIALGEYTSAVIGHNKKLKKKIEKSADSSGELVGFLPFNRYLPPMIKSDVADIVNSTSSKAGSSITAALFLDRFIKKENKKKWLHFDIAGPAYREKVWGYNSYGATGVAVRMICDFLDK